MKLEVDKPIVERDVSKVVPDERKSEEVKHLPMIVTPFSQVKSVDREIVQLYIDDLVKEGFRKGAVVVPANLFIGHRIDPLHWGFIVAHNTEHVDGKLIKLLKVRWANGSFENVSEKGVRLVYRPYWQDEAELKASLSTFP